MVIRLTRAPSVAYDVLAVSGLALLTLTFYWSAIRGTQSLLAFPDNAIQSVPWLRFSAHWLHRGVLPLWDPHQYAGHTFIGDPQSGLFYPPNLLLFTILGDHLTTSWLNWYLVSHVFLGAASQYALLRVLAIPRAGALVGGCAFAFGGFVADRLLAQTNIFMGAVWLPLAFLFFYLALTRSGWFAPLAGIPLALSFLAGHIQPPAFIVVALIAYAIWFVATTRPVRTSTARASASLAATLTVAIGLSAIQLLPSLEYNARALRWVGIGEPFLGSQKLPYRVVGYFYILKPSKLVGFLSPSFAQASDGQIYVGIVTLVLAAVAVMCVPRRATGFWIVLGTTLLLYSLGHYGLIHHLAYFAIPFSDKLREPIRGLFLVDFAVAVLAAYGAGALARNGFARQPNTKFILAAKVGIAVVISAAAAVAVLQALEVRPGSGASSAGGVVTAAALSFLTTAIVLGRYLRLIPAAVIAALCLAVVVLDLLPPSRAAVPLTRDYDGRSILTPDRYYASSPLTRFLQSRSGLFRIDDPSNILSPNAGDFYGLDFLMGHGATIPKDFFDFRSLGWAPPSRFYDLLNVKYVVAPSPIAGWHRVLKMKRASVYANPSVLPRARLVGSWQIEPDQRAAQHRAVSPAFPYRNAVVLESAPAVERQSRRVRGSVRIVDYNPTRITYAVRSSRPAILMASEVWYPGWTAKIDGARTNVLRADGLLRAVAIPAGTHRIVMTYRPTHWRAALVVLFVTVGALVAWMLGWAIHAQRAVGRTPVRARAA